MGRAVRQVVFAAKFYSVHMMLWFAFTMEPAIWSRRTSTRPISKSG